MSFLEDIAGVILSPFSGITGAITDGVLGIFGRDSRSNAKWELEQQNNFNKDFAKFNTDLQLGASKDLTSFQNQQNYDYAMKMLNQGTSAQVAGMKNAGLNPALLNGSVSAPQMASSSASTPMAGGSAGLASIAELLNAQTSSRLADAQIRKSNAETESIEKDNLFIVMRNALGLSETEARIASALADAELKKSETEYNQKSLENRLMSTGLFNKKTSAEIGKLVTEQRLNSANARNVNANTEVQQEQAELTRKEQERVMQSIKIDWYNAKQNKRAVDIQASLAQHTNALTDAQKSKCEQEQKWIDHQDANTRMEYNNLIAQLTQTRTQTRREKVVADFAEKHPWIYNCSHLIGTAFGVAALFATRGRVPSSKGVTYPGNASASQ